MSTPINQLDSKQRSRLGDALQEARGNQKQKTIAAPLGISPSYLSNIESGRRVPSLGMLLALANMYNTTIANLMERAGL